MKKILPIAMIAVLTLALVACAPAAEAPADTATVEGTTWMLSHVSTPEGDMDSDMIASMFGETYYTFEAEGVLTTENSIQGVVEGTWSQDGANVTITAAGVSTTFTLNGSELLLDDGAGNTSTLTMVE